MGSIWSETVTLPSRSALEGEHSTEVAVVGGGMAGVLTAWFLRQRGAKVLLLEAERLVGVISIGDVVKCQIAEHAQEADSLRSYIAS